MAKQKQLDVVLLEGNTLRKMDAAYSRQNTAPVVPQREEQPTRSTVVPEDMNVYLHRHRVMAMDRGYLTAVLLSVAVCLAAVVFPLNLMAKNYRQKQELGRMESGFQQLKENNDATYNNLMSSVDYQAIRDRAINEFGMAYPSADQVVQYDAVESNFMRQTQSVGNSR